MTAQYIIENNLENEYGPDNDKSLSWCFDCCNIPIKYREAIEKIGNKSKVGSVYGTVCKKEDQGI